MENFVLIPHIFNFTVKYVCMFLLMSTLVVYSYNVMIALHKLGCNARCLRKQVKKINHALKVKDKSEYLFFIITSC